MTNSAWLIGDLDLVANRKALWKQNKEVFKFYFYFGANPEKIRAIEKFFLTGEECKGANGVDLISAFSRLLFHADRDPDMTLQLANAMCRELESDAILRFVVCLLSGNGRSFGNAYVPGIPYVDCASEVGLLGGDERKLIKSLLPDKFDFTAWSAENSDGYVGPYRHFSPGEAWELMCLQGKAFISSSATNPFHPVQDFINYWQTSLPHLAEAVLSGGLDVQPRRGVVEWQGANIRQHRSSFIISPKWLKRSTLEFFHALKYFREPRGYEGIESPARCFRDRVVQILEQGTGNKVLDELWAFIGTAEGRTSVNNEGLPPRIGFAGEPRPEAMRWIVDAWREQGFSEEAFDPAKTRVVNAGRVIPSVLADVLGYKVNLQREAQDSPARLSIPAYHYRVDLHDRISLKGDITWIIEILYVLSAPGTSFDANRPQLLVIPRLRGKLPCGGGFHDALCERQVAYHLHSQHGFVLAKAESHLINEKIQLLEKEGTEHTWRLGYLVSSPYDRLDSKLDLPDWSSQHPGVDLNRFLEEVKGGVPPRNNA